MIIISILSLYRICPAYVHTLLKLSFSLASFKILIRCSVRFSAMLIFFPLSFFTFKNLFTNIVPRKFYDNWTSMFESLFCPILCVLSKSANNMSSFSSSLNNSKTLSSVRLYFSSFNPRITISPGVLFLPFHLFLNIFYFHNNTFQATLKSCNCYILVKSIFLILKKFLGYKIITFCQIS